MDWTGVRPGNLHKKRDEIDAEIASVLAGDAPSRNRLQGHVGDRDNVTQRALP